MVHLRKRLRHSSVYVQVAICESACLFFLYARHAGSQIRVGNVLAAQRCKHRPGGMRPGLQRARGARGCQRQPKRKSDQRKLLARPAAETNAKASKAEGPTADHKNLIQIDEFQMFASFLSPNLTIRQTFIGTDNFEMTTFQSCVKHKSSH